MTLHIPRNKDEVHPQWVTDLLRTVLYKGMDVKVSCVEVKTPDFDAEGVLSDIKRASARVFVKSDEKPFNKVHNLFIKVLPWDQKNLIIKNHLFEREIIMYREVFPLLMKKVIHERVPDFRFQHFLLPKYIFGEIYGDNGVLVLEDLSHQGYGIQETSLGFLDLQKLKIACSGLAEFHALSMSFDIISETKLEDLFPILRPERYVWFQEDMIPFMELLFSTSKNFLRSLPGNQEISRRFEERIIHPTVAIEREIHRPGLFRCLQHGDSWNNNFLFRRKSFKTAIVDWQTSYSGNGLSDLCFLIFSSSIRSTRLEDPNFLRSSYFNHLIKVLRSLLITEDLFNPSIDDFHREVKESMTLSLLLCGNIRDLRPIKLSEDKAIADESEMKSLKKGKVDSQKAGSIMRRQYVEICSESLK